MTDPLDAVPQDGLRLDEMLARLSRVTEDDLNDVEFAAVGGSLADYALLKKITDGMLPSTAFLLGCLAGRASNDPASNDPA